MQPPDLPRAVDAAMSIASNVGLKVSDAVVLHNSNKLGLRLLPCDVFARIAHVGSHDFPLEIGLALELAGSGYPVVALEPRAEPLVYEDQGFAVTLWTYYDAVTVRAIPAPKYADALSQLHAGMRSVDLTTPHFTDRVSEAQELVSARDRTPSLAEGDRTLLSSTLDTRRSAIVDANGADQLLHGEPHPGNVLLTGNGLLFVDLETCCRGPVEFDLAHVPDDVSECYPGVDQRLLDECRVLAVAMVAAWRCDSTDQLPNGERARSELLNALRAGPPWPSLHTVLRRAGLP